jgi:hypothetical protein
MMIVESRRTALVAAFFSCKKSGSENQVVVSETLSVVLHHLQHNLGALHQDATRGTRLIQDLRVYQERRPVQFFSSRLFLGRGKQCVV